MLVQVPNYMFSFWPCPSSAPAFQLMEPKIILQLKLRIWIAFPWHEIADKRLFDGKDGVVGDMDVGAVKDLGREGPVGGCRDLRV